MSRDGGEVISASELHVDFLDGVIEGFCGSEIALDEESRVVKDSDCRFDDDSGSACGTIGRRGGRTIKPDNHLIDVICYGFYHKSLQMVICWHHISPRS